MCLAGVLPCAAQVLARPGWAGSGVAPEAWWRRAVFYRMAPERFQDANGDGKGDLQGVIERLDYLQSVGVDALLLDGSFDTDPLEDLVREASRHHLRVVVAVSATDARQDHTALLKSAHEWLSAGVGGIAVLDPEAAAQAGYAGMVGSLRQMLQSYPGERVLLTDPVPGLVHESLAVVPARGRHTATGTGSAAHAGLLVAAGAVPVTSAGVSQLRTVIASATAGTSPDANGLIAFAADPATEAPNAVADAAMLLLSRGAAVFDFGDEIGLDLHPTLTATSGVPEKALPVMQWTPSNHTPAATEQHESAAATPGSVTEFGAYHPYQPPPRSLTAGMPGAAKVVPDANIPVALPDPDTLPGFTSGALPVVPVNGARLNVVTEDRDPRSLLNAYRQLIGLHHDNATLRNGTQSMINRDADGALVWVRRAPAGSRTVANVVVGANLTDRPATLALDADLEALGMRGGALRPLFASSREAMTGETTAHLTLPPHAVFAGEIYHAGQIIEPAPERRASRRSRHRVRR